MVRASGDYSESPGFNPRLDCNSFWGVSLFSQCFLPICVKSHMHSLFNKDINLPILQLSPEGLMKALLAIPDVTLEHIFPRVLYSSASTVCYTP